MSEDLISRQEAIDSIINRTVTVDTDAQWLSGHARCELEIIDIINALPSAQPDYQEVLGWLLAYHTKSFDLHGRYLPREVISWLINDFTQAFIAEREHDG